MVGASKKSHNKTILINIRQLQTTYTGVQSYIYNLAENLILNAKKTHFQLLVHNYGKDNQYINKLASYQNVTLINHHSIQLPIIGGMLFDLFFVNQYIRHVDLYFNPVNMVPFHRNKNIPHLVGVLDLCTFIVPQTTTITLKTYYDWFLKDSLNRADHIITISHNTKDDLIKLFGLNSESITPIHLGIDPVFAQATVPSKEFTHLAKEYSLFAKKYFITIATSPRKNVNNVINGYLQFAQKHPSIKLFIISTDKKIIKAIQKRNNEINLVISKRFLNTQEIKSLYSNSLGLIYCPLYEGFGLPVLEAMISNCPVITTKNSSLPEIAKEASLYVEENSPRSLSRAMEKLYTSDVLSKRLATKGLTHAEQYNWEKTSIGLIKTIERLLS